MEENSRDDESSGGPAVEITNEQAALPVDEDRIRRAVLAVLGGEGVSAGAIGVAIVDDATIHDLNKRHLNHNHPTDVISFPFECRPGYVEGEVVVSAETARNSAQELGWPAEDELLLYVVHGALHLAGYDDLAEHDRHRMRRLEQHYLAEFGLTPPWD